MSQYYNNYQGGWGQTAQQEPTPGLKALKNSFGSTTYLIATICYSLTLVLALVELFVPSASIVGAVMGILQNYAYQYGLDMPSGIDLSALASGGGIVGGIIGMIPSILICLAMWLIFGQAKKASIPASTAGYSILQTLNIISVVLMCLSTLMVVIFGIIGLVAVSRLSTMYSSYMPSDFSPSLVVAIALLISILIMVFAIIYYVKVAAIYGTAKDILRYNKSAKRVSMFVIVINFIGLFFSIFSLLGTIVGFGAFAAMGGGGLVVTIISSIASFLFTLFNTLTFLKARREFDALSQKGTAGYQSYNYETGAYNTGSYNTGSYNFNTGSYQTQNYQQPNQYQAQNYQQPNAYQAQSYQQPDAYQAQSYQQPDAYQAQSYQQPDAYQAQSYQQPDAYQAQSYQQPDAYQAQSYQQPDAYQAQNYANYDADATTPIQDYQQPQNYNQQ